ncbi:MAG: hypothetical protein ACD_58C00118G0001 [uncultured bacterium]|nr:MAG: hypothetical protein ACD_58C00118G0001 [uncultured bacterium]
MDYLIHFTRITISGRIDDEYLAAQAKSIISDQKINKGSIFAVVEINNTWFSSAQIGQSIINALVREYARSSNSSDLVNFELSLKKVNETLGKITQNGETEWIGKLNSCLVLVCNDQIHIAKTGKAEGLLIRQNKINSITDGFNQNPDLHPLKTFSDIISGSLLPNDKVLITSPKIFEYFSKESLKQIISNNDSYTAAQEIANRLKKQKERKVSAIIFELLTKEEATNKNFNEDQSVVYIDQSSTLSNFIINTKDLSNKLLPYKNKFNKFTKSLSESFKKMLQNIQPQTKKLGDYAIKHLQKGHKHLKENVLPKFKKTIKPISDKVSKATIETINKNKFLSNNLNVRHYTERKSLNLPPILQNGLKFIKKIINYTADIIYRLFELKNRSILYALIVIILSIILILSINNLRGKQSELEQQQVSTTIINESKTKFNDDYKLALLYNDKQKARNILNDILTNIATLPPKDEAIITKSKQLSSQVQDELDKLDHVNRIKKLDLVTEFDQSSQFSITHDNIYSSDKTTGVLTSSTKTNAHKETITLLDADKVITTTSSEESDCVYALTNNNKLFKVTKPLESAVELKPSEGDWKTGVGAEIFAGNIYILDSNGNQIWKYNYSSGTYSAAQSYLTSGVNIGDGVDLAIDGVVYVLKKDGNVYKLSKGRTQDFKVSNIPSPNEKIANPLRIYTNADANYLYVLDGNRLLELEKSGKFVAQYIFDGLNELKDFSLNTKTKEIWLLNGNKVYKGNL